MDRIDKLYSFALKFENQGEFDVEGVDYLFSRTNFYILKDKRPPYPPYPPDLINKHEVISFSNNIESFYALDALNTHWPQPVYEFYRISNTRELGMYDVAICSYELLGEYKNKQVEDFTIHLEENASVKIYTKKHDGTKYLVFISSIPLKADRLIGITLRVRHGLSFMLGGICSERFVAIGNKDEEMLSTYAAKVKTKTAYSLFSKPHEWDYTNSHSASMSPLISKDFMSSFFNMVVNNSCIYSAILLLTETAKYNEYANTAISFVALEMISGEFGKKYSPIITEDIKNEISKIKNKFEQIISEEKTTNGLSNEAFVHIKRKIDGFMTPTNADKLSLLFNSFNIQLNKDDKNILKLRNKYLHGSLSTKENKEMEDFHTFLSAHRLASTLIAKIIGYSGYICYYDRIMQKRSAPPPIAETYIHI